MDLGRIVRHLCIPHMAMHRAFPAASLRAIEEATRRSELRHRGQIRFAVETSWDLRTLLKDLTPRARAEELFARFRIWDTEENNGILIYVLLADRHVEIVADRGIHARVGDAGWQAICHPMEEAFRAGRFEDGVLTAIETITRILVYEYPRSVAGPDEVPNQPAVLP